MTTRWKHFKHSLAATSHSAKVWAWHHLIRRWTILKETAGSRLRRAAASVRNRGSSERQAQSIKVQKEGCLNCSLGRYHHDFYFFIFLTCIDHFWCSRNFSSSKSLQDLLLSSTTAVSEQSNMRFESERELCCRRSTPLSRLGRTGELEWAPLIADSGNPLLLSLLHPDELWQRGHLQLQASVPPDFFFSFFCGQEGREEGSRVSVI